MSVSHVSEAKNLEGLVVFVDDTKRALSKISDEAVLAAMKAPLSSDFRGKYKESLLIYTNSSLTKRVLLVGTGSQAELSGHKVRALSALAVMAFKNVGVSRGAAVALPSLRKLDSAETAQALSEGALLAQLGYDELKTDKKPDDKARYETLRFSFLVSDRTDLKPASFGFQKGTVVAEAVNWSRRLIMTPPGDLLPSVYIKRIQEMVSKSPVKSQIKAQYWTEKELAKNKFGGVLGVAQGSDNPPYFVVLEYFAGKKTDKPVVLVGKGVTFDSGGLSLKPPPSMETMKYDMAGSASVLGAFKIITDLKLKVNLVILAPLVENMPSGKAIRPGDVLRMASGKTVEVLNTDAEGRLILADALYWATTKYEPKAVVDVATLTGACALAVGEAAAGIFANNKKLSSALLQTGVEVQENLWPLPDFDDFYVPLLKSDIADLKNVGGREGGASTASIFLRNFVLNNAPWAHLDIAGCGWYDGPRDFITMKGSSGVPIRLLAQFVENAQKRSF